MLLLFYFDFFNLAQSVYDCYLFWVSAVLSPTQVHTIIAYHCLHTQLWWILQEWWHHFLVNWLVSRWWDHTHTPSGHPDSESHAESVHPYLSLLQINFIKQQLLKLSHTLLSAVCVQASCFYDITHLCKISRSVSAHLSIFQAGHMSQTLPFACNYAQ